VSRNQASDSPIPDRHREVTSGDEGPYRCLISAMLAVSPPATMMC
jgi:hypothetical protein